MFECYLQKTKGILNLILFAISDIKISLISQRRNTQGSRILKVAISESLSFKGEKRVFITFVFLAFTYIVVLKSRKGWGRLDENYGGNFK